MANKVKSGDVKKVHHCIEHDVPTTIVMHCPGRKIRFEHGDCSLTKQQTVLKVPAPITR